MIQPLHVLCLVPGLLLVGMAAAVTADDFNYDEDRIPSFELPDPLLTQDGQAVTSIEQWEQVRRPELLRLFQQHVFGRLPDIDVELKVESHETTTILDGLAVREQITIHFGDQPNAPEVDVLIYTPAGSSQPVPGFVGLNFSGNHTIEADPAIRMPRSWVRIDKRIKATSNTASAASRGLKASRWDVKQIVSRGYALVTAYYGDIDPDFHDGFANGIHALEKQQDPRPTDAGGSIAAWAWGLSRILDVLQDNPRVDGSRMAVFGHSRLGKTSLWAGASDPRFQLVISNNSGCGGAALSRRRFGETVARINKVFPHWFCTGHREFDNNEDASPVDHHQLMALMAPRPVYVASAVEDRWADPRGEMLSLYYAGPVYEMYGKTGLPGTELPELDQPIMTDVGYHIRSGKHDVTSYDWEQYLNFADKYLK